MKKNDVTQIELLACQGAARRATVSGNVSSRNPWAKPELGRRRKHLWKFTLIELLIVVAIIAILVAILLPMLSKAKERARRVICMSNLKQIHVGMMNYNSDFDGYMPSTRWGLSGNSWAWAHSYSRGVPKHSTCTCVSEPNLGPSGWHVFTSGTDWSYVPWEILRCPSMDKANYPDNEPGDSAGFFLDYEYRYNSWDTSRAAGLGNPPVYPHNILSRTRFTGLITKPLFTDAATARRSKDGTGRIFREYREDGDWLNYKWAHYDGGNMIMHDGSALWVPNGPFLDVGYQGWPALWGIRFAYYDTLVTP